MYVKISEDLYMNITERLVAPKNLQTAEGDHALIFKNRNHVLNRLLDIRYVIAQASGLPPTPGHQFP